MAWPYVWADARTLHNVVPCLSSSPTQASRKFDLYVEGRRRLHNWLWDLLGAPKRGDYSLRWNWEDGIQPSAQHEVNDVAEKLKIRGFDVSEATEKSLVFSFPAAADA